VLVKIFLPQGSPIFLRELSTCLDFEALDESQQTTAWFHSLGEEMEMIWHEAVGVNIKTSSRGLRAEHSQQPVSDFRIQENLLSLKTANSDEVKPSAKVPGPVEVHGFSSGKF